MGLFAIKGLQEQQDQIKALTTRIEALEQNGTVGDGSVAGVDLTSPFVIGIKNILAALGLNVGDKSGQIKTVRIEKIEMVDSSTGEIYCTWIENGEWKKQKGACDAPIIPVDTGGGPTPTATETPAEVLGCTNLQATNYNSSANKDDGSCVMSEATPAPVIESPAVEESAVEEPTPAVEEAVPVIESPAVEETAPAQEPVVEELIL
jgi:hypothetical protein